MFKFDKKTQAAHAKRLNEFRLAALRREMRRGNTPGIFRASR